MAKNVAHAGKGKSLSSGEANENERRGWSEATYRRKNQNRFNNYDWSRHHLNFEIKDGKILPLGSQDISLYKRYHNVLKNLDFKQYKIGATNQPHTYVELIMSGSTEKMQKIAFGDQQVDFERNPERWKNWSVSRTKDIEDWALDIYNFVCKKYGKENIIGFEVHLDETEPHIHVNIVPTAIKQVAGRSGGYHKIMMEDGKPKLDEAGNTIPATYTKGKHVGEMIKISESKYNALSDEKKQEYRHNERGTVRTVSFAEYFGSTKTERSEEMSTLHTEYYEQVGKKWGFERGDVWALLSEEEKRRRRHRTKEEAGLEREAKEAREKADIEKILAVNERDAAVKETARQNAIVDGNKELIDQQKKELDRIDAEKREAFTKRDAAVSETKAAIKELEDVRNETARNEKIIDRQATTIGENKNDIEAQEKTKAELQKSIDMMGRIENLTNQNVSSYVQDLEGVDILLNNELRNKLISPLKNHPRIQYTNPPLTARELERIALDEEAKVINRIGGFTGISKNKANEEIRAIRTDVQTIYFSVVSANQRKGIEDANRNIYKNVRRELAEMYKKADKYEAIKKEGVSEASQVKELKEDASRAKVAEDMLEFAWPGVTKAKNVLSDPTLDKHYMTDEQKKQVLKVLREEPKNRLEDIEKLIDYAGNFRNITPATKAEAITLAAEECIKNVTEKGYDVMAEATKGVESIAADLGKEIGEVANSTAAAAVCLMFGYLDAATTVSNSMGGGGGNPELPKKKDDEDNRHFYGRCMQAAIKMHTPKKQQSRGHHM